jgi:hypothetical protein
VAAEIGAAHLGGDVALAEAERPESGIGVGRDGVELGLELRLEQRPVAHHVIGRGVVLVVMRGAVIALAIVLEDDLPVRLDHVVDAVRDLALLERVRRHLRRDRLDGIREIGRVVGEVHEDQAGDVVERHRKQPELGAVDLELALRRRDQLAVEIVGPAVIGADELAGMAMLVVADARAAMAAEIVEGADLAVLAAHHDDHLRADPPGEVVAALWDRAGVAGEQPAAVEDVAQVRLEHLGRGVEGALERAAPIVPLHEARHVRSALPRPRRDVVHETLLRPVITAS